MDPSYIALLAFNTVSGHFQQFLSTHYNFNLGVRPIELLDGAWKDGHFQGAASISYHEPRWRALALGPSVRLSWIPGELSILFPELPNLRNAYKDAVGEERRTVGRLLGGVDSLVTSRSRVPLRVSRTTPTHRVMGT
ncbi:hypothetical protein [Candidatus Thiodictyon syntrophicum]|jgi:hypothetical protein|uniref:Uncharacterized protein n=1 Tax=Candidatus Thiodictyon syntrophicum TaxID=1166950 RepID=A0A2K8UBL5_9GAMM|nr:hypothetical protein [Candidatus Thiodictyon syntrophicum]AUB82966.1 hypothetical protein THSYN_19790 [Candidatus Thiodictyon syntrophicum]